jgi:hypothetical protein
MHSLRSLSGGVLAGTLALAVATPASAAPPRTYDGTFNGDIVYSGCTTTPPPATTSGTWAVTLHGKSAEATFDIYVNGEPHVAYTFPGMKQLPVQDPTVFSVTGATQAGPLTVTLSGSELAYTISPYSYDGLTCQSVTYPGTL